MTDLDKLLGDAASDTRRWSADPPVTTETIEGRARRRRAARLASAGATALVAVVVAAVTVTGSSEGDGDRDAVSVAAEPPQPAVRTVTPEDVQSSSSNGRVRIEGLPTEGVAVEDGDTVVLLSTSGAVLQRLDGFHMRDVSPVGELKLDGPDGTAYELDALAGVLAPLPPEREGTMSLSYGATLMNTESSEWTVERDGHTLFSVHAFDVAEVSWDRDIVTRMPSDPTARSLAFDLRTSTARRLPAHCRVADRHGPAWFLVCGPYHGAASSSIVRLDADGSTKVLAASADGASWVDTMVSPDGSALLAYACGFPTVSFGPTSTGVEEGYNLEVAAIDPAPLGWTAGGEAVLHAAHGCGITTSESRGVFAFDGEQLRTIYEPEGFSEKAAMWMPVLERR